MDCAAGTRWRGDVRVGRRRQRQRWHWRGRGLDSHEPYLQRLVIPRGKLLYRHLQCPLRHYREKCVQHHHQRDQPPTGPLVRVPRAAPLAREQAAGRGAVPSAAVAGAGLEVGPIVVGNFMRRSLGDDRLSMARTQAQHGAKWSNCAGQRSLASPALYQTRAMVRRFRSQPVAIPVDRRARQ